LNKTQRTYLVILGHSLPVINKNDLQSFRHSESHIRFLAVLILCGDCPNECQHDQRLKQECERIVTSSLPLFVPRVPSFLAPAREVLASLLPEAPPWDFPCFDEDADAFCAVACKDFCIALFVSLNLSRREAGTHSSHLFDRIRCGVSESDDQLGPLTSVSTLCNGQRSVGLVRQLCSSRSIPPP
jgi:hypothetical protein